MYVVSAIVVLVVFAVAVWLLRLRVQLEISNDRRSLFVGLGRTGREYDYLRRVRSVRVLGFRVSSSPIDEKKAGKPERPEKKSTTKPPPGKPGRKRPLRDILRILPECSKALWGYTEGILRSLIIEHLEAEIKGGFDTPDLTGQAFGYYQAALAAAPAVVGRVRFTPDWTGPSLSGSARVSVALPLYLLLYRSLVLAVNLPLRQIVKLAIGKKRGDQDG
ncbi:MAG: hypothetical protein KAU35_08515 [candidate division Zixibacteria bacterium]|nr:hypothetical protein [candidate division Zixibacteria bacterium]